MVLPEDDLRQAAHYWQNRAEVNREVKFGSTLGHDRSGKVRWTARRLLLQDQCAIIMFDVTSRVTYKNDPNWHSDLVRVCESLPDVLCGNKVNIKNREVLAKAFETSLEQEALVRRHHCQADQNFKKPFL